jgi:hypothetical protein
MRINNILIFIGLIISSFLIIFTPLIPAIEFHTIKNNIETNISENIQNLKNSKEKILIYILNPLIEILLILLKFLKDLSEIFIGIIITIFDNISITLNDILDIMEEIQKPLINIFLSFLIGIYMLLMFTSLVLLVQFTGIIVIIYLLIEKMLIPLIYKEKI